MTQGDPLSAGRGAANLGESALSRGSQSSYELAEVLQYNSATHTSCVRTHSGRPLHNVPALRPSSNDFEHYSPGTTVVIAYVSGIPVIFGVLNMPGPVQPSTPETTITGVPGYGDDNALQAVDGDDNYRPANAPTDMMQGDWAHTGEHGSHVAVLKGGVASLGSPSALIRSLGIDGCIQLIAKTLQTFTDFGQWEIVNDEGQTSFVLHAGACQSSQTGLDEEHWTIRLSLGAIGNLFDFQITDPVGKTLFKLYAGSDGRVQIYGDAGVDISSGANGNNEQRSDILGARTNNIGADDTLAIDGNRSVVIGKAKNETINTDRKCVVGNADTLFVNSSRCKSVGGPETEIVAGGSASSAKPGDVAKATKILNGSWTVDIGNPADGASASAQQGFSLKTAMGDVAVDAGAKASIKAKQDVSLEGLTVKVNGDGYSILKTEDFLSDLKNFLTDLVTVLQIGTAGSPVKQQLTGLTAMQPLLEMFIQKLGTPIYKSMKAKHS